jgi:hypothetical protein
LFIWKNVRMGIYNHAWLKNGAAVKACMYALTGLGRRGAYSCGLRRTYSMQ